MAHTKWQLPPPANWQDFEDLCLLVWRDIWRNPTAQKNGRQGQAQAGVDVFGRLAGWLGFGEKWCGVQCKLVDQRAGHGLSHEVVVAEARNAESFRPTLAEFTIATTARRDAAIQESARRLTTEREGKGLCSVQVYSWDDISDVIQARGHLMRHIYSQFISEASHILSATPDAVVGVVKGRNPIVECRAFFDSEDVSSKVLEVLRHELCNVTTELCLNAMEHGGARSCNISISQHYVQVSDNGVQFNPVAHKPDVRDGVGLVYLQHFLSKWQGEATPEYSYQDGQNTLRITFKRLLSSEELNRECMIVPKEKGRFADFYSIREYVQIPEGCRDYYFDVPIGAFNPSSLQEFLGELFSVIPPDSRVTMRFSTFDGLIEDVLLLMLASGVVSPARIVIG